MKVRELIEKLSQCEMEDDVVIRLDDKVNVEIQDEQGCFINHEIKLDDGELMEVERSASYWLKECILTVNIK